MTRATIAATIITIVAVSVVAASITTPVPGTAAPDPLRNRTMPDQGGTGDGPTPDRQRRPTIDLPGVTVPIPVAFDLPPWLGAGLVVALLAAMLLAVLRELRDRPTTTTIDPVTPEETTVDSPTKDAIGEAAGRAADHLLADTDAPITNDVYRAWQAMTAQLPVTDPETTTPREFAAIATDAGFDPDAVETVTTLFEQVRYGTDTITEAEAETVANILTTFETTTDATDAGDTDATAEGDTDTTGEGESDTTIPDPWEDDR